MGSNRCQFRLSSLIKTRTVVEFGIISVQGNASVAILLATGIRKFTLYHIYSMCDLNRDSLKHCSQGLVTQLVEYRNNNPEGCGFKSLSVSIIITDKDSDCRRVWDYISSE